MKILVSGSEGYIGTVLVEKLVEQGFDVVGLDSGFYKEGWLYDGVKKPYAFIKKDIRNVIKNDVEGFDVIVHLGELSNDPIGQNNPEITYDINHRGTIELAKKAKKARVCRFVYASSCSVYGASNDIKNEESFTHPLTPYAKCKVLNEQALLAMTDDSFSPIILRNATAFGPSPRMRFDLVINNLAGRAFTTGEIKMESDGTPWRPFIHVEDVCQAVIQVLKAPREIVSGQIFNVGDTRSNYQIREIAEIISKIFTGCSVSLNKEGRDKRNYRVNFDKIHAMIPQFYCQKNVEEGVKELFDLFKKINLTKETFESRLYTRLKQIRYLRETGKIDDKFFWV